MSTHIFSESQTVRLTKAIVEKATTDAGKRIELRDSVVSGLVLRVSPTGLRRYVCKISMGKKTPTIALGSPDKVDLEMVRIQAREKILSVKRHTLKYGPRSACRVTLRQLILEATPILAKRNVGGKIWSSREHRKIPDAVGTLENVFQTVLDEPVRELDLETINDVVTGGHNVTAPGSASRGLSYLRTLYDWAANRGKFAKIGSGRKVPIELPEVQNIYKPAEPRRRERTLNTREAGLVWREVTKPDPGIGHSIHRFIMCTASRRGPVAKVRCGDINPVDGTWTFVAKGGATKTIGLSPSIIAWVTSLPSYDRNNLGAYLFPNSEGGPFCDWDAATKAIQEATGTTNWTRHDLRRTAASALESYVDDDFPHHELLSHANPGDGHLKAKAVVDRLMTKPHQSGIGLTYRPESDPGIEKSMRKRTRAATARLEQYYEECAMMVE